MESDQVIAIGLYRKKQKGGKGYFTYLCSFSLACCVTFIKYSLPFGNTRKGFGGGEQFVYLVREENSPSLHFVNYITSSIVSFLSFIYFAAIVKLLELYLCFVSFNFVSFGQLLKHPAS